MANRLKRLFQDEVDLTSNSCDWKLELFQALVVNAVFLCDADALLHWSSAAEEAPWVGLKPDFKGGTGFNLLRSSFGPPCKGNVFKKGSESGHP